MRPEELDVEKALKGVLGEELSIAEEFEAALDARDLHRARELLDLVDGDALQIQLMRAILRRWEGAKADESHE